MYCPYSKIFKTERADWMGKSVLSQTIDDETSKHVRQQIVQVNHCVLG